MSSRPDVLPVEDLRQFAALREQAIAAVTERFYREHGSLYARFGERGRAACREDLGFHLDFLGPVLEYGDASPLADYLAWLEQVLSSRGVPSEHLALSLDWLGEFFSTRMPARAGAAIVQAIERAKSELQDRGDSLAALYAKAPAAWPQAATFEAAALGGDRAQALGVITECLARGPSLPQVEQHVVQAALYNIGRKWQRNEVTVAQEHLAIRGQAPRLGEALEAVEELPAVGDRSSEDSTQNTESLRETTSDFRTAEASA